LENCIESNKQQSQSLENTGNILRQIEEAQQYLKLCEASQVQINDKEEINTLGALLSGLIQNGSDCALRLREAAGEGLTNQRTEESVGLTNQDATNQNLISQNSTQSGLTQSRSRSSLKMKENDENETLTSSDEEFLDAEEGDDSVMSADDEIEFMVEDKHRGGEEGEGMDQHKSVIIHLIKQVRIGMDLTKVVLPTFILERRSLLEMYSDFFAHADFYSDIPTKSNPRERMLAVIKWYLTSFHAGRNGSVAKKVRPSILYAISYNAYVSLIILYWVNHSVVSGVLIRMNRQAARINEARYPGQQIQMFHSSLNKSVIIHPFLLSTLKISPKQFNSLPIFGQNPSFWECRSVSRMRDMVL
jgi:hypothetical protein